MGILAILRFHVCVRTHTLNQYPLFGGCWVFVLSCWTP
jgi:hypothetical protein